MKKSDGATDVYTIGGVKTQTVKKWVALSEWTQAQWAKAGQSPEDWLAGGVSSWHHVFPVELKHLFQPAGIRINQYGIDLPKNLHDAIHEAGWNGEWIEFFKTNPSANKAAIMQKLNELTNKYHGADFAALRSPHNYRGYKWTDP
jgi:hypothetical protein